MTNIAENLQHLRSSIAGFEHKYSREIGSVHLLAASKGQSAEHMAEAFAAGQVIFGESYLQEALDKMVALSGICIEWHFIGPIQSNKTKKIAEHFNWVHSVDDPKIAKRLSEQRPDYLPPLDVCIEVNISQEETKSGISPKHVLSLAQYCLELPQLRLRGLMAIPAPSKDIHIQRREFHKLYLLWRSLRDEHRIPLDTLSMGMSDDFEAAIAEGSTCVRIGRGLFGNRA